MRLVRFENSRIEFVIVRDKQRGQRRNVKISIRLRKIEWHGHIILVINSRSTDEYSGSLDHTRWSVRIHAHRCIFTRESSSRIWRETAFDRSSIGSVHLSTR